MSEERREKRLGIREKGRRYKEAERREKVDGRSHTRTAIVLS